VCATENEPPLASLIIAVTCVSVLAIDPCGSCAVQEEPEIVAVVRAEPTLILTAELLGPENVPRTIGADVLVHHRVPSSM